MRIRKSNTCGIPANSYVTDVVVSKIFSEIPEGEIDFVESFCQLIADFVRRDPNGIFNSINVFTNPDKWAGGVPNLRTGVGKVSLHEHPEWGELFSEPRSFHIPRGEKVRLVTLYLQEVVRHNHRNPEMWRQLNAAFPSGTPLWNIMEKSAMMIRP
jgi:hypothetical protein